jgi:hypothetical protein
VGGRLAYRFASSYDDDDAENEDEDAAAAEDAKEDGDRRIRMTPTILLANTAAMENGSWCKKADESIFIGQ